MPALPDIVAFAVIALGIAMTPGPNMAYVVSRSISQGRSAGFVSLGGIAMGLSIYMVCAAFGLTTFLLTLPHAYDAIRLCGVAYLLWLAWEAVRPGGKSPFKVHDLPSDPRRKLFGMGLMTSLLNPKVAVLFLSLLPQFVRSDGGILRQLLALGMVQIAISMIVYGAMIVSAASVARVLTRRPLWMAIQRWLAGTLLAGFAVRMATEARR